MRLIFGAFTGSVCAAFAGSALAETLADALALAYQSNPTLQQARAQQKALDETSVQARSGFRPTLGVGVSEDFEQVYHPNSSVSTGGATLNLSQPLYTSGRVSAAVRSADASVAAGRETLRATEDQILLSVVTAYMDVLRDQAIVSVRQDDVSALSRVLDEVSARREVGQITRTDVVQIQSQLQTAKANLASALAQLQNSRAEYAGVVGRNPGTLAPPPNFPEIPGTVDAAFDAAEIENPSLRSAKLTEQSSRERIAEARAAFGPSITAGAQYGYQGTSTPAQTIPYDQAFTAQISVTQPLFAGGANSSLVRQSIEQNEADRLGVERARRAVVQSVAQSWNQTISLQQARAFDQSAYEAAKLELEGMQEEYKVALRSTLEVLSADEQLRAAELNIAAADHDEFVAQSNLLASIGRLEAGRLIEGTPLYDSTKNFKRVRNKGAVPYEFLIAGLDQLSIGKVGALKPIAEPASPRGLVATPAAAPPSADAPLATVSPETPDPAITAAKPPPLAPMPPSPIAPPAPTPRSTSKAAPRSTLRSTSDQASNEARALKRSNLVVQIGAYPSLALAEEGWSAVREELGQAAVGKTKTIEPIKSDGPTLYRALIGGFASGQDAKQFCEALKAKGGSCFLKSLPA